MAEGHVRAVEVSPVAAARNWQNRVRNEMDCNKQWTKNWGFLVKEEPDMDSLDHFTAKSGDKKLATATMIGMNKRTQPLPPDTSKSMQGHDESLDEFVHLYMMRQGGLRPLPQSEFKRPVLSSHTIGWGKNLEMFGDMRLKLR